MPDPSPYPSRRESLLTALTLALLVVLGCAGLWLVFP